MIQQASKSEEVTKARHRERENTRTRLECAAHNMAQKYNIYNCRDVNKLENKLMEHIQLVKKKILKNGSFQKVSGKMDFTLEFSAFAYVG